MVPMLRSGYKYKIAALLWVVVLSGFVLSQKIRTETLELKSNLTGRNMPYNVFLPVDYDQTNSRYPVLYLLHGLFGRYDNWITHTNLADYAAAYRMIVVTPEGGDGWYTDSATVPADKYETYIVKE